MNTPLPEHIVQNVIESILQNNNEYVVYVGQWGNLIKEYNGNQNDRIFAFSTGNLMTTRGRYFRALTTFNVTQYPPVGGDAVRDYHIFAFASSNFARINQKPVELSRKISL